MIASDAQKYLGWGISLALLQMVCTASSDTRSWHIFPHEYGFIVDLPYQNFLWKAGTGADFSNISLMELVVTDDFITGGNGQAASYSLKRPLTVISS